MSDGHSPPGCRGHRHPCLDTTPAGPPSKAGSSEPLQEVGAGRTCEVTLQGKPAPGKATAQPCKLLGLRVRTELLGSGEQWGSLRTQSACSGHSSEIAPVDTLQQHINVRRFSTEPRGRFCVALAPPRFTVVLQGCDYRPCDLHTKREVSPGKTRV